ncbi:excinuclease ABC subunit UvrC [Nonlabens sp. Ci31]|jgi:excinuclease ABC subunit C|uniref:excinuclease ABC subunit UvrC n=1 Tax=Nonlabens sp. Ci31 TaxID=2608253 RepID=UPI001462C2CC|nr:excinuclease ABC subunit UvrC [Nonlabens sp. Ci31]QJP33482.1 excinuclease ABC subunit UvrC [Nonlabens sp. Ci31]
MELPPLEVQIKTLPLSPGVYLYFNKKDQLLYVGKAKMLKKRVSSYFTKSHDSFRIKTMVKNIHRIEHIVVDTETDALLLENSLIKSRNPRYNIMLRDDKTYPWLVIKKERFPRVFLTRKMIKDGSEYYGPYTSVRTVRTLLELVKTLYPIRTCNYDLQQDKINEGKFKLCLEYHIGNCKGPCTGLQHEVEYNRSIEAIRGIVKGDFKEAVSYFTELMQAHAVNMEFEEAQQLKEKLEILTRYQAKSTVVNPNISNVDIFTIVSDEAAGYVNYIQINHGAITRSHTMELKKQLDEDDKQLLELAIVELRNRFDSQSTEIYTQFEVEVGENLKVTVPKLGDKKRVVDLSERNAKFFRQEQFKTIKIVDPDRHTNRLMIQMKADLHLDEEPRHLECFDNSNIQGTNPVAACVVFKNGKPSKKDYRNFNIKTVEGPDDFASMEEVVYRRYRRLLEEDQPLPQLIIVDGGKGQLSSGVTALERLGLRGKIPIIGIAKRLEELFYPNDPVPLYLDKRSETLKVIQQMRNEAHRFGITHHRNKRSKQAIETELDEIPGVGEKTVVDLLKHFRSVKRVKIATKKELAEIVGVSKAQKIIDFYKDEEE